MTKKKLQQQIDELKERLQIKCKTDYAVALGTQWVLGSSTRNFYASDFYDFKDEIIDRLNKLEQYLNIEYKVTESKREEGYVKKEKK